MISGFSTFYYLLISLDSFLDTIFRGAKDLMHKTADSNEKHALFGKNSQFNTPALPDFPSK